MFPKPQPAYAFAASRGEPILATGNDFRATGIALLRF